MNYQMEKDGSISLMGKEKTLGAFESNQFPKYSLDKKSQLLERRIRLITRQAEDYLRCPKQEQKTLVQGKLEILVIDLRNLPDTHYCKKYYIETQKLLDDIKNGKQAKEIPTFLPDLNIGPVEACTEVQGTVIFHEHPKHDHLMGHDIKQKNKKISKQKNNTNKPKKKKGRLVLLSTPEESGHKVYKAVKKSTLAKIEANQKVQHTTEEKTKIIPKTNACDWLPNIEKEPKPGLYGIGPKRRENGKFGSLSLYDNYSEESDS